MTLDRREVEQVLIGSIQRPRDLRLSTCEEKGSKGKAVRHGPHQLMGFVVAVTSDRIL
jgi:hypothetical protein